MAFLALSTAFLGFMAGQSGHRPTQQPQQQVHTVTRHESASQYGVGRVSKVHMGAARAGVPGFQSVEERVGGAWIFLTTQTSYCQLHNAYK